MEEKLLNISAHKIILGKGGSFGLGVMGRKSCLRGTEFVSQFPRKMDRFAIFLFKS